MKGKNIEIKKDVPYSYLIMLPREVQINEMKKLHTLNNIKVSWKTYTKNKKWTETAKTHKK